MNKFRIVPIVVANRQIFQVDRWRNRWPFGTWCFETFADTRDRAKAHIEHLDGPILQATTAGKAAEHE